MFDSIGWGEIIVLALLALFIFGPERLPDLAKEAAAGLKKLRTALTGVRAQVDESLGDDFAGLRDLDLRQYHPRTFIKNQLLTDDEDGPRRPSGATAATTVAAAAARARNDSAPPPFDPDAT
ncbi:twin-arginine translocase TatA/TatE family subunit [Geodermatophilus sp. DSM 44513]|uniref:twin-arginine translocase TatA/TatE family subunit n=1 Tax=Geodermatophilus sp. DSM 44513 TaxID=1528104 RepID=UPI00126B8AB0|nr:twin-arginine translocase TatA/TatE family subunit [Geodermatophilus sp. DSM 44513]WNV76608.1 twin-arginine translocase TatA/TatE family subunit [Geodermatophilus sp. DSM 44513]